MPQAVLQEPVATSWALTATQLTPEDVYSHESYLIQWHPQRKAQHCKGAEPQS